MKLSVPDTNILDIKFISKVINSLEDNVQTITQNKSYLMTIMYSTNGLILADNSNIEIKNALIDKLQQNLQASINKTRVNITSLIFQEYDKEGIEIILEKQTVQLEEIKEYHKNIHPKHKRLFTEIKLVNANFINDNIDTFLKHYFLNNKQPFEVEKTHEISIYYNYFEGDINENNKDQVMTQIIKIKSAFNEIGARIGQVYSYGKKDDSGIYKIMIEIVENGEDMNEEICIMLNDDIYKKLLYYYRKVLVDEFICENKDTKSKLLLKSINLYKDEFCKGPDITLDEINEYKWLIKFVNVGDKNKRKIWNRKNVSIGSLHGKDHMWCICKFTKIYNQEVYDSIKKQMLKIMGEDDDYVC
jgi:S-adenosylmethionine/arginine decarboxylase-like enzyme